MCSRFLKDFSRKGAKTQSKTLRETEGLTLRLCAFAGDLLTESRHSLHPSQAPVGRL